jgi:CubicO group peptidase (beta-lactamase class C family)
MKAPIGITRPMGDAPIFSSKDDAMHRGLVVSCGIAACIMAAAHAGAAGTGTMDKETSAKLDAIIAQAVQDKVFPGAVLVVGRGPEVVYQKAFGRYTYDTTSPAMAADTLFDLASVSKVAGTATAAALLLEDGSISLDDLVSSRIAGFEAGGKGKATVKDLLTHVSGLPAYTSKDLIEKSRKPGETAADAAIRFYATLPAKYEPRTSSTYSCLNMQTMARINEDAAHMRQHDLLKQRVYDPLGMKDTGYYPTPEQKQRCAPTILRKDGTPLVAEVHDPLANYYVSDKHCPGNAGLYSTGPDLARFVAMFAGGGELGGKRILKSSTVEAMTSVQTPPAVKILRGLGWQVYEDEPYITDFNKTDAKRVVGHTGYTGTLIWLDKNTGAWVVFLTNRTFPDDASKPKGAPSISDARKDVCDAVLRAQPEYKEWFAKKDAAGPKMRK